MLLTFIQALIWRQQIGADKILEDYVAPDVLDKYRTGGIFGYDKEGAPIYIDPFGLIDLKGWLDHFRDVNW